MLMIKTILAGAGLAGLACFTACNQGQSSSGAASTPDAVAANVDSTVNPAQDFFDYANGGWIKRNPIPSEYSSWGIGNLVQEELYKRLRIINEKAVENPADPISKKIAAFWKSGMDSVRINADGIKPIENELKEINAVSNTQQLVQLASKLNIQMTSMCDLYIAQDAKNSEAIAVQLNQGDWGFRTAITTSIPTHVLQKSERHIPATSRKCYSSRGSTAMPHAVLLQLFCSWKHYWPNRAESWKTFVTPRLTTIKWLLPV